ncbi:MAG: ABC transporter ATP-binding protein [Burkholderiaceae bacterium]
MSALMEVDNLEVAFGKGADAVHVVNGVSFSLPKGQVLGILGESGSGKSVMLRALMGLLPKHAKTSGSVRLDGQEIVGMAPRALRKLRGSSISMIFQEPMTAFDPVFTVGKQIIETIRRHEGVSHRDAARRALELMELVSIPSARSRLDNYPHEMSGGMRQRAMIALALACRPKVLLADEPTTALDVTVQIQILLLLRRIQAEMDMSIIFVTHDIGVAVEVSDHIGVMYAGRFIEKAPVETLIDAHCHPYTQGLLASTVHGQRKGTLLQTIPGAPPNLAHMPPGCAFAPRCSYMQPDLCLQDQPAPRQLGNDHTVRCVRVHSIQSAGHVPGIDLARQPLALTV